jgi:phosphatidylglycerophosphatase C
MQIAFFDFDGTITKKDSFIDFIQYVYGVPRFLFGFLWKSPYIFAFKAGIYPNYRAKEQILSYFFGGMTGEAFQEIADKYSREHLSHLIKSSALERICHHKLEGHTVVVVSASISNWMQHWCESNGLLLISSKLEIVDGKITGKLDGKNCHGPEKVARIKKKFNLDQYHCIYAYGDSSGDTEMLALADVSNYRVF